MANNNALKVMFYDVTFEYSQLGQDCRNDMAESIREPDQPELPNSVWTIQFNLDAAKARKVRATCKAQFEASDTGKKFRGIFGMKKNNDGSYSLTVNSKDENGQGEVNKPPLVIDGMKQNIADRAFCPGTIGSIRAWAVVVTDKGDNAGISLFFDAVQVTDPVYNVV